MAGPLPFGLPLTVGVILIAWFLARVYYNLYLHPLSKYPGPTSWAAFRFTMLKVMMQGRLPYRVKALHDKYGPVVRTAPDELSFIKPEAWKDIYQHRNFCRPVQWRGKMPGVSADNFISADARDHARLRKVFGPAFSDRAVRGYEPWVQKHIDSLSNVFHSQIAGSSSASGAGSKGRAAIVDMVKWLNFCAFDIMMDIGWGTHFDLLGKGEYHPWVTVTLGFRALIAGAFMAYYEPLGKLAVLAMPKSARDALNMLLGIASDNVEKRLSIKTERQDVFFHTLGPENNLDAAGISRGEMQVNSMVYTIAGSEPITTALTGMFNYLLRNQDKLDILCHEIRSSFASPSQISGQSTQSLPYLNAILKETLRVCSPTPDGLRREIPAGGAIIAGHALPPGTVVSVPSWALFQSERNFEQPRQFIPERWLDQPTSPGGLSARDFPNDRHDAFHPFSYGPRNCIGQNLAWLEMRVLVSRLLYEFDISIPRGMEPCAWDSQPIFWSWDKKPMMVEISDRAQA